MATQVQRRKGTTAQHSTFTGAQAELTVDTDKNTVVVHDGATAGGFPLARDSAVVHLTGNETIAGTKTFSSNPVLSAGTANGVAYLNGSKVLTTGSALVFDGTNLGLGVTPSAWGTSGLTALQIRGVGFMASDTQSWVFANAYFDGATTRYINNGFSTYYRQNDGGAHKWYTAASGTAGNAITFTQAMTLSASGNLLVGRTNLITFSANSVDGVVLQPSRIDVSASSVARITQIRDASGVLDRFYNGASVVGDITCTTSATAYNTSSDYRLKENIQPMTGALAKVAQLKPCTYNWKADGSAGEGFIAHELQEVVPQCVTGEKDAVDAEGKPVYQGIDTSFLVATLTAALQEAVAEINQLKARLDAANL